MAMNKRVLDVGNCGYDHGAIAAMLTREFGAETVGADTAAEALKEAANGRYDLVLVNRVLDADGGDGLAIVEAIKGNLATKHLPVMLITNYADYQAAAVKAGAEPGFGKKSLGDVETVRRLAKFLGEPNLADE
jgi:CheY-like chemotaxis protein